MVARSPHRRTGRVLALAVAALPLALATCSDQSGRRAGDTPGSTGTTAAAPTSSGAPADATFEHVWVGGQAVASLGGAITSLAPTPSGDLLVAQRDGAIRRVTPATGPRAKDNSGDIVLDLRDRTALEPPVGGLLGIALTADGRLAVDRTAPDGTVTLSTFAVPASGRIDPATEQVVLRVPHPFVHKGGGLVLTPDGDLLVSIGAFTFSSPSPGGGDLQNPDGVIIRIPRSALGASSGQFEVTDAAIVARGMRNPWRFSLDSSTGDLWIGDVGETLTEEIDHLPASSLARSAGQAVPNLGWPYFEGSDVYLDGAPADLTYVQPVWQYRHDEAVCAVVGGYVYRGRALPGLAGDYVFGDNCSTSLHALHLDADGSVVGERVIGELPESPNSLGVDADGELYALGGEGGVYRLTPSTGAPPESPATADTPVCLIAGALSTLARIEDNSPAQLEQRVLALRDVLEAQVPRLPDDLRDEGDYLRRSFDAWIEAARSAAWDVSDPTFRRYIRTSAAERGPFPGQLHASNILAGAGRDCP